MKKNFKTIIGELEKAKDEIENKGISIAPLNKALEDLKVHVDNIEAIELNMEAVKAEVIDPIKKELDENKLAGTFSKWGFVVGGIGLFVTAFGLLYSTFTKSLPYEKIIIRMQYVDSLLMKIDSAQSNMKFKLPFTKSINLWQDQPITIYSDVLNKIITKAVFMNRVIEGNSIPVVYLSFYINNNKITGKKIRDLITFSNKSNLAYLNDIYGVLVIGEQDKFTVMNKYEYTIDNIFSNKDGKKDNNFVCMTGKYCSNEIVYW